MIVGFSRSGWLGLLLGLVFLPVAVWASPLDGGWSSINFSEIYKELPQIDRDPDEHIREAKLIVVQMPESASAHALLGIALFDAGKMEEARAAFEKAIGLDPNESDFWTQLGVVQMETEQLDEAERSLLKAVELNSENRFAHQRLGYLYEYGEKIPKAIFHFQKGLIGADEQYLGVSVNLGGLLNRVGRPQATIALLQPRLPQTSKVAEAHLILATAYLTAGQYEKALGRFERFLELRPQNAQVQLGKAMARRGMGDVTASLALIDELIAERPDWPEAHAERGVSLLLLDRKKEALAEFEKAEKGGVKRRATHRHVADYHLRKKEFVQARDIYEKLIELDEADPEIYARLSELMLAQKQRKKGEQALRDGLKRFPGNGYLQLRLGSYLASLQRYGEAQPLLREVTEKAPGDLRALKAYSLVQMRAGELKGALEVAARLHELVPDRSVDGIYYASLLELDGQDEAAEKVYSRILEKERENAVALNNLAALLTQRGELQEAERLARRANGIVQNDGRVKDTLGWILLKSGKHDEALKLLAQAIELSPNVAAIHYHKGLALVELGRYPEARVSLKSALELEPGAEWAGDVQKRLKRLP